MDTKRLKFLQGRQVRVIGHHSSNSLCDQDTSISNELRQL